MQSVNTDGFTINTKKFNARTETFFNLLSEMYSIVKTISFIKYWTITQVK